MIRAILIAVLVCVGARASDKLYWASVACVAVSEGMDAASSLAAARHGAIEDNALLGPRFDARALGIKSAIAGATMGIQISFTRRKQFGKSKPVMTWVNFAACAASSAIAAHNWSLR